MKFFPVLLALLAWSSNANAQTPAQQNAARAVFERFRALNEASHLNTAPARALVTGEAKNYTAKARLGALSRPDAFVFPDPTHAVLRVQDLGGDGTPMVDVYFYLVRQNQSWKITALRSLALTQLIEEVCSDLEHRPQLSPAERDELANLRLTLALDADLRLHFARNSLAFARLSTLKRHPLSPSESAALQSQLSFDPAPSKGGNGSQWIIGGMSDNTVGYGFSASGRLPPINPNEYIWVERLSPHWYLFRTT